MLRPPWRVSPPTVPWTRLGPSLTRRIPFYHLETDYVGKKKIPWRLIATPWERRHYWWVMHGTYYRNMFNKGKLVPASVRWAQYRSRRGGRRPGHDESPTLEESGYSRSFKSRLNARMRRRPLNCYV